MVDRNAATDRDLRIVDESGEYYWNAATAFVGISLPDRDRSSLRRAAS